MGRFGPKPFDFRRSQFNRHDEEGHDRIYKSRRILLPKWTFGYIDSRGIPRSLNAFTCRLPHTYF